LKRLESRAPESGIHGFIPFML